MLHGELQLFKCKGCDKHVTRQTLLSGNSFGQTVWTDGRIDMPMMPRKHDLPFWYCPECQTFQGVSAMKIIEELGPPPIPLEWRDAPGLWKKAYEMQEPGWRQYLDGIRQWQKRLVPDPDLETFIRLLSWHRYNDRFRHKLYRLNKKEHDIDARYMPPDHWAVRKIAVPRVPEMIENCNDAANWLYEGNPDKGMDKADMLRWLGRYELALQLLGIVRNRNEFDVDRHKNRHQLLTRLCEDRDSSLAVVTA